MHALSLSLSCTPIVCGVHGQRNHLLNPPGGWVTPELNWTYTAPSEHPPPSSLLLYSRTAQAAGTDMSVDGVTTSPPTGPAASSSHKRPVVHTKGIY